MKRNLLFMLAAFFCCCFAAQADDFVLQRAARSFQPLSMVTASAGFEPSAGVQVGYCDTSGPQYGVGSSSSLERQGAIYVPAELLAPYAGMKVTQVLVGLNTAASDLKPLIMKTLGTNLLNEEGCDGVAGWNTLTLSEPYVLDGGELYVGYSCVGTYAIGISSTYNDNGLWLLNGSEWMNFALYQGWESLCVRFVIEGEEFPLDLKLSANAPAAAKVGESVTVTGSVESLTTTTVSSYEIECAISGGATVSKTFSSLLAPNDVATFSLQLPAVAEAGLYDLTVRVSQVNGQPDENPGNSTANLSLKARTRSYSRRLVVEEGTGTWCGWCVYGIDGMRKMKQKYPDDYIGIAIHASDEMSGAENYGDVVNLFGGFPSCFVNRDTKNEVYPRFANMEAAYLAQKDDGDAAIEAQAVFADADRSKVTVKTQAEFGINTGGYRIAYVVLENGVGPYDQANFVSGSSEDVGGFESLGSPVNMLFDDVARGIYGSCNGVEGSVPDQLEMGKTYDYSYTLTLPGSISNKDNIEIVALLISKRTGEIVNACKTTVASLETRHLIYMVDGEVYKDVEVAAGAAITPEPAPEKEGHTFSGWEGLPETMPDEDVTVSGTFTVNAYELVYLLDGEEYARESVDYGTELAPKEAPAEREGYTFSGWEGLPETMPAKDVTVSGAFTVNAYELVYMVDGEEYARVSVDYGTALTPMEAPEKEGHTFGGWEGLPETMPAKDVAVSGTFTVNAYELVYLLDGEEYARVSVDYGTALTPMEAPAEREGYTFGGWEGLPETMPAEDVTVNGVFKVNSYTVTYYLDGEVYRTETVEYGAKIVPPAVEDTDEYLFAGWQDVPETMPAHDVEIHGSTRPNGIAFLAAGARVDVYSLQGVLLRKGIEAGSLRTALPAGLYIVNGQKVWISK